MARNRIVQNVRRASQRHHWAELGAEDPKMRPDIKRLLLEFLCLDTVLDSLGSEKCQQVFQSDLTCLWQPTELRNRHQTIETFRIRHGVKANF